MAVSKEFLDYILDQLSTWNEVTIRRMFGGAGLFCDGKMFALVADDVAYLKVGDTNRDKFTAAGSSPFKPFPDKATIMSYFEIPPDILENPEKLMEWSDESLSIQKKSK